MVIPTFTDDELLFHPHYHPCPLCGELVSDTNDHSSFYNQRGELILVRCWYYTAYKGKGHPVGEYGMLGHNWCYPDRDMPLPNPMPWWLKVIKRLMK